MLWSYLAVGLWQQKHIYNKIQVVWNGFHQSIAAAVSQRLSYRWVTFIDLNCLFLCSRVCFFYTLRFVTLLHHHFLTALHLVFFGKSNFSFFLKAKIGDWFLPVYKIYSSSALNLVFLVLNLDQDMLPCAWSYLLSNQIFWFGLPSTREGAMGLSQISGSSLKSRLFAFNSWVGQYGRIS